MRFDEIDHTMMREYHFTKGKLILPFIANQVLQKIIQMNGCHLFKVYLTLFYFYKPVASIGDVHINWMPKGQIYHVMVVRKDE